MHLGFTSRAAVAGRSVLRRTLHRLHTLPGVIILSSGPESPACPIGAGHSAIG